MEKIEYKIKKHPTNMDESRICIEIFSEPPVALELTIEDAIAQRDALSICIDSLIQ